MKSIFDSNYFNPKNIYFWVFLFFVIRLIGITNPPLEIAHNWRQSTVVMVARNFHEQHHNLLYPRIDIAGEKTGITGMEFPILNYSIALTADIFGYQHWYGRLINLIISSLGIIYFFRLVRNYFNKEIAFTAALLLLSSIWFAYARKMMPDTFSVSFIIASFYFGSNYLENRTNKNNIWNLLISLICLLIGALSKIPAAYLIAVYLLLFLDKRILLKYKIILSIGVGITLIPVILWYFLWVPHLVEQFGFWHFFMGKNISQGWLEISTNLNETLKKFYSDGIKYIGFSLFLYGMFLALKNKHTLLLSILGITTVLFFIIILQAGETFYKHSYYIIPYVPIMVLIASYAIHQIHSKRIQLLLVIAICLEGVLNQIHDFRVKPEFAEIQHLSKDLNTFSLKKDLILINSGSNPTPMYFAHRKGWVFDNEYINDPKHIVELNEKGLKYIVVLKQAFAEEIKLPYPIVIDKQEWCVYKTY